MFELLLIVLAVAGLWAALSVMQGVAWVADKLWPGCVDRLGEWLFR